MWSYKQSGPQVLTRATTSYETTAEYIRYKDCTSEGRSSIQDGKPYKLLGGDLEELVWPPPKVKHLFGGQSKAKKAAKVDDSRRQFAEAGRDRDRTLEETDESHRLMGEIISLRTDRRDSGFGEIMDGIKLSNKRVVASRAGVPFERKWSLQERQRAANIAKRVELLSKRSKQSSDDQPPTLQRRGSQHEVEESIRATIGQRARRGSVFSTMSATGMSALSSLPDSLVSDDDLSDASSQTSSGSSQRSGSAGRSEVAGGEARRRHRRRSMELKGGEARAMLPSERFLRQVSEDTSSIKRQMLGARTAPHTARVTSIASTEKSAKNVKISIKKA
eukprot:105592_1